LAAFQHSYVDRPDPDLKPLHWTPDPANDFAPRHGSDDQCDGYSRQRWYRMLDERGIKVSRKAELKAAWEGDPDWERFPARYQQWGYRPYISQIMQELTVPYWRKDALAALKLLTPRELHPYLDEVSATDPGDLRRCFADRDQEIIAAFQQRCVLWKERKKREAQDARTVKREIDQTTIMKLNRENYSFASI
jgi:hypothetical protein